MAKWLHEFLHFNNGVTVDNGWWKINEDFLSEITNEVILTNPMGGYHYHVIQADDIIVEGEYENLDLSYLLKPNSPYGWLSPEGEYYGCDYQNHELIAQLILKSDSLDLECNGWVKLYRDYDGRNVYFFNDDRGRKITKKQEDWLLERDFVDNQGRENIC